VETVPAYEADHQRNHTNPINRLISEARHAGSSYAIRSKEVSLLKSISQERNNRTYGVMACGVGVLVASFMTWGTIQATPSISVSGLPGSNETMPNLFGGMTMTMEFNGWNGSTTFLGMSSPNWLPVILALLVSAIVWLDQSDAWKPPKLLAPVMSGIGLLQLLALLTVLLLSGKGAIGLGLILATVMFVFLLSKTIRLSNGTP